MDRLPRLSVNIPCYRQLHLARRAIASVLAQSFADFEVNLLDDGASDEYRAFAASLGDRRVRYHRNPERLGAMRNMFAAIGAGRGEYTFAFHEDDLIGRQYLAAAVDVLDRDPRCGFVAGQLREFADEPSEAELSQPWDRQAVDRIPSPADYLTAIFRGVEPMFGSIVYRRAALAGVEPRHDALATLVDRPFLLAILEKGWTAAIVRSPLVWYRRHAPDDVRHYAMTTAHILRLFEIYRAVLAADWTPQRAALYYGYARAWLLHLYDLTPPEQRPPLRRFLWDAWRRGVYRPTLRGHGGLWQLRRRLLAA